MRGPGSASAPLLQLRDVSRAFGAVRALRGVGLDLAAGEIRALIGENGAGKSTLVKILAGALRPDSGDIHLDGRPVTFDGPAASRAAGIAVIYQEPTLFPDLSVAENIFMSRQPLGRRRRIDAAAMRVHAADLFRRLGHHIDPDRPARGLSIADQQLVEIAKALSFDARLLIMDEPTAALSGVEVERLFAVARALREGGTAVLFISHRFDEVFELCDSVTVMRDGAYVATQPIADVTVDDLVRQMVGRDVSDMFPGRRSAGGSPGSATAPEDDAGAGEVLLEVEGLSRHGVFADVGFAVRSGEIVALAGLVGAGRSEIVRAIFGIDRYDSGTVRVAGRPLRPGSPQAAMDARLALVPEDRRQQGLIMDMSVERNVTLPRRWALSRFGLMSRAAERRSAATWAGRFQVRVADLSDAVSTLSGGNQQKAVLAKWLSTGPRVLIVDEPTRGIDVGTKADVHRMLSDLAAGGLAVVMVSSELPEVLGMADRVLVMHEGRLVADIPHERATEESVMYAATAQEFPA